VNTTTGTAAESTLKVSAPNPQEPINDQKASRSPVALFVAPASGVFQNTSEVQLFYRFQVFGPTGGLLQDSGLVTSPRFDVTATMEDSVRHTWRARAESGPFAGPWSAQASFLAPNPRPCGPPNYRDPYDIIGCHIGEYGDHLHGALELFLMDVAIDLNRAGVAGGPFGRLVKTTGNNCGGYSCDIICAGQGRGQRQYDILIDERFPIWGNPMTDGRIDICEVP
jgi:hypothetical protein